MTPQREIEAQREFLAHDKGAPRRSEHLRALRRRLAWVSEQCDQPTRGPGFPYLISERRALEYAIGVLEALQRDDAARRERAAPRE